MQYHSSTFYNDTKSMYEDIQQYKSNITIDRMMGVALFSDDMVCSMLRQVAYVAVSSTTKTIKMIKSDNTYSCTDHPVSV